MVGAARVSLRSLTAGTRCILQQRVPGGLPSAAACNHISSAAPTCSIWSTKSYLAWMKFFFL